MCGAGFSGVRDFISHGFIPDTRGRGLRGGDQRCQRGSSPHARERAGALLDDNFVLGFIPACAGKGEKVNAAAQALGL
jgi:hypothetical protein